MSDDNSDRSVDMLATLATLRPVLGHLTEQDSAAKGRIYKATRDGILRLTHGDGKDLQRSVETRALELFFMDE